MSTTDPRLTRKEAEAVLKRCTAPQTFTLSPILAALAAANAFRPEPLEDGKYEVRINNADSEWLQMMYRLNGAWRASGKTGIWDDENVTPLARLREEPL